MGGIADYSGSLVLQLPLECAAFAAVQWSNAMPPVVTVRTADPGAAAGAAEVRLPLAELTAGYAAIRARLAAWAQSMVSATPGRL